MKSNSFSTAPLSPYLTVILAAVIVVCLAGKQAIAQVDTKQTTPTMNITSEELEKLPSNKRDLSKLILTKPATESPTVLSNGAPGFSATLKTPTGLDTIVFTTPKNETVEVYLPKHVSKDSTFTGTIKLNPANGTKTELGNYYLVIEGQAFHLSNGLFQVPLSGSEMTRVGLVDKNGKVLAGVAVPVYPTVVPPAITTTPNSGTSGNLIKIDCACRGPIGEGDYVKIGGQPMQILASSPGSMVVLNTYETPGLTEIETKVGPLVNRKDFRNIGLQLSADKLTLLKGESTTVHIVVLGLEKLKAPAVMIIEASGVVTMGGGNSQTISIDPSSVSPEGTYRTAETLYANSAGTFNVTVTVSADDKK